MKFINGYQLTQEEITEIMHVMTLVDTIQDTDTLSCSNIYLTDSVTRIQKHLNSSIVLLKDMSLNNALLITWHTLSAIWAGSIGEE